MTKLSVPKNGTAPAPSPLHNMTHPNEGTRSKEQQLKEENKRTTILINPTIYRKFKSYAAESGQTVTALINNFMEETLAQAGK